MKNALPNVKIIYYPLKIENVGAAIKEIINIFHATNLDKYMK